MLVLGCRIYRAKDGGASGFQGGTYRFKLADCAHLALAFDGGIHHQRVKAQIAQGCGGFLHFGRPSVAVAGHALEVVIRDLSPIERGVVVLQGRRHFIQTPARAAARKQSSVSASIPLIITLRIILMAAAEPVSGPTTDNSISSSRNKGEISSACGPAIRRGVRCRAGWMAATTATST